MNGTAYEITKQFGISWTLLAAQVVIFLLVAGLFVQAARVILTRGRGWEVPVWLFLSFCIPVVFPIIALIHFRKPKRSSGEPHQASLQVDRFDSM